MVDLEKIIADFVKGAERAGGRVERQTLGTEEKLAVTLSELGIGGLGLGAAGLSGAVNADEGHRGRGALGSMAGGTAGLLGGAALGGLVGRPILGGVLGGTLGSGVGGALAGTAPEPSMLDRFRSKLSAAHAAGVEAAKLAFLGSLLATGASALAPSLARGALGKVAPKALGAIAKPMAGAMFDTGIQMGAQKALQ